MRVLQVSAEIFPLLKTGGLADIAGALRLGTAAFPEDGQKRLVLLSDGNENSGEALGLESFDLGHSASKQGVGHAALAPRRYLVHRFSDLLGCVHSLCALLRR